VHREHRYLKRVFKQIRKLGRRCNGVTVLVAMDRPEAQVMTICQQEEAMSSRTCRIVLVEAKAVVTNAGCAWMEQLRDLYSVLLGLDPKIEVGCLWDDDMIWSPALFREARGHLQDFTWDRLEVQDLFLWDREFQYNDAFPDHWHVLMFRVVPGDDFALNYVVHCPDAVAKSSNVRRMTHPSLNYGYFHAEDRPLLFRRCKESGRIDAHTLSLVKPPVLKAVSNESLA
jgi:hypothetical protein